MIWAAFRAAVFRAVDDRAQEQRRTRALERIAATLEQMNLDAQQPFFTPPPYGPPPSEHK